jgi:hypothetical protein
LSTDIEEFDRGVSPTAVLRRQVPARVVYTYLAQQLQLKNMGAPQIFLGLNVSGNWKLRSISLNQSGYILALLQKY